MRSSTLSRRALGIAAAGVLGLTTLALPGVALADPTTDSPVLITPGTLPGFIVPTPLPPTTGGSTPAAPSTSAESSPSAEVEVVAAAVPAAPYLNSFPEGTDGGLRYNFVDQSVAPDLATSFEYTIDSGAHWAPLTDVQVVDGRTFGTVTGLTNGAEYTTRVRAVNSSGASGQSNAVTAMAYKKVGVPTNVVATRSVTGVTVTWGDPASAGTYSTDYFSVGYSGGNYGDEGCRVAATVHTCTIALPSGDDYMLSVFALDSQFNSGEIARLQSGAPTAPAPTAVPAKDDGDLLGTGGAAVTTLTAGKPVVLTGTGYLPGSSVRLTMFSSPVELGTVTVASDGTFSATVTVPANLANGTHHLVATGYDAQGNVRNLVITVTVSGGVATLATTGFDAVPVALGGGLFLLAGAGMVVGARRRSTNA